MKRNINQLKINVNEDNEMHYKNETQTNFFKYNNNPSYTIRNFKSLEESMKYPYSTKNSNDKNIGMNKSQNSLFKYASSSKRDMIAINNKETFSSNKTFTSFFKKPTSQQKPINDSSTNKSNTSGIHSIDIASLYSYKHIPLNISNLNISYSNLEQSRKSKFSNGSVIAYSANTHNGTIRNYNEDRVSIILNVFKPISFKGEYWPKCSYFAIYDGHGGRGCADFLRDNLHNYIFKQNKFPDYPINAIEEGFAQAEHDWIYNHALSINGELLDHSGSCAIVALVIGN